MDIRLQFLTLPRVYQLLIPIERFYAMSRERNSHLKYSTTATATDFSADRCFSADLFCLWSSCSRNLQLEACLRYGRDRVLLFITCMYVHQKPHSQQFQLVDANRKKTGAKLEIQINLHEPIAGEDIVKRTEKWVIVDESSENTSQLLLRAGLTSGSANASVASTSAKSDLDLSATDPVQRESKRDRGPPQQEQLAELEEAEQEFNK